MKFISRFLLLILSLIASIGAGAQCDASFSFVQTPDNCASTPVQFTSNANPATVRSYSWNFGDGGLFGTDQNPTHSYPVTAGNTTYTVRLTVRDTSGTSCNFTQDVTIVGAAPILITVADSFLCTPDTSVTDYNFSMNVDPASMALGPFTVDYGDGTVLTLPGPVLSHTYTNYGTFDVTVTGSGGGCSGYYKRVFFYTDPIASIQIVDQPFICEGQSITVRNTSDISRSNIDYFLWDWGDFGPTYTVSDTSPQSYRFNLDSIDICVGLPFSGYSDGITLTAYNQCSDHFTLSQIKVRAKPRADFDWPQPVCLPNAVVQFNNLSCPIINYSDPATFVWTFEDPLGGTVTSSQINPSFTYTQPGSYRVTLVATNNCGADTSIQRVNVIPPPVADFELDTNEGCVGFCVSTTNLSTPGSGVNYRWDVFRDTAFWAYGDTTMDSSSFEPIFCFSSPDTFPIRLIAQNVCGVDSVRDTVFARLAPSLSINPIPDTCGASIRLDSIVYNLLDYGATISAYNWTFTGTSINTFSGPIPPALTFTPGNNSISLCVENICGTTCFTENFIVAALPNITVSPDTLICLNDTLQLNASPQPGYWRGPSVDSTGLFIPDTAGTYCAIYTYLAASCNAFDTVKVTVRDTPAVSILTPFIQECIDSSLLISLDALPLGGNWSGPLLINGNQFRADTFGTFVFQYTVPDSLAGCEGRGFATIVIDTLPQIDSIPNFVLYCSGSFPEPLPLVQPTGGTWTGSPAIVNNNSFDPSLLGGPDTVMIYYTFTNANNCFAIDSMEVRVVNPSSAFAGLGDSLCFNHGVDTLRGMSPLGGTWSIPAGNNYLLDPLLGTYNTLLMQSGANSFTYTVFEGTSCEVTAQTSVEILDTTAVSVGPDTIVCSSGSPFLLSTTASGGFWSGLGIIDPVTGLYDPTQVPAGSADTVCYSVTNLNNCLSQDCLIIQVDSLPTPGFGGPTGACVGDFLTFPITSTYATSHQWNFGDGSGLTNSNTHTYFLSNTFTITQYAITANGCVDSLSRTIDISEPPAANFSVDVDSGCADLTVTITNNSSIAGGTCFWDFGDGTTSTSCNPLPHTFVDSVDVARYTITHTIANLCDTVSFSKVITVFPRPQVVFDSPLDTGCSVFAVQFGNLTTGRPDRFDWYLDEFRVDSLFSTDSIPAIQYYPHVPDTGFSSYTVYLVANNQCGADTSSQEIVVYPNTIDALFNTSDIQGCAPLSVTFSDLSGAPFTSWEINGTNPPGDTVSYTFINPGTYTVKHQADNGCSFDTNEVVITVYPQPFVDFTADTTTICLGDSVRFFNQSLNINAQEWNFGDGMTSTAFDPVHQFNQAGTFTVVLTAYADTNACFNQDSLLIQVLAPPQISFTPSDTAGCPPLNVSFTGVPANLNYLWRFGDGGTGIQQQPMYTYDSTGFYIAELTVIDNLGCENSVSQGIRVHEVPEASFVVDADTSCAPGNTLSFQNLTIGANSLSHSWDFGDGSPISTVENPVHSYNTPGNYTALLIEQNAFMCADTFSRALVVLPQTQAIPFVSDSLVCVPASIVLEDNSLNNSARRWLIDGQVFSSITLNYSFTIPKDTCYQIQLITDTAGYCLDTTSIQVCTSAPPVADFSPDQDQHCGGPAIVNFLNQSQSTRNYTASWDFGDGGSSTELSPTHIYTNPGEYIVSLNLLSDYGCVATHSDTIYVYPQPEALISISDTVGCVPMDINLADVSQNNTGRIWEINGQSFSTGSLNYTFSFPADTCYQILLRVDTAGFCFDTASVEVCTASPPLANFAPDWRQFCDAPALNSFTNTSQASLPMTYQWSFGDGGSSVVENPDHLYQQLGTFAVKLVVTNTYGCQDSLEDFVEVLPQPAADLQAVPPRGCSPLEVSFTNLSLNYSRSSWDFGDGSLPFGQANAQHTYFSTDTMFTAILRVDTAGFCFDTAQTTIRIASAPIAAFEASLYEACGFAQVDFINQSSSAVLGLSYLWVFGNGDSSSLENPTITFTDPGTYEVLLIARNTYGCTDTARRSIEIYPQAAALFMASPLIACSDRDVVFENLSTNATQWLWNFGDGNRSTASMPIHQYENEGIYDVELIVSFDGQCADTFQIDQYIRVNPSPEASFIIQDTTFATGITDGFYRFTNTSQRATRYRWDFGNGDGSDEISPLYQYLVNDTFRVSLVAYSDDNCMDTAWQDILLKDLGKLYVPNAFAPISGTQPIPGSPGTGDLYTVFYPRGVGLSKYHVAVYSRWGELLWESRALENGEPSEWWNGKDVRGTGKLMTSGVYIWQIHEAIFDDGSDWDGDRTGNVTLIR